jgi:hypothetical protein
VLVVRSEDVFERPAETFARVFEFLGLPAAPARDLRGPDTPAYEDMPAVARTRLVEYFRPHNARLYDLLGRDLGWSR